MKSADTGRMASYGQVAHPVRPPPGGRLEAARRGTAGPPFEHRSRPAQQTSFAFWQERWEGPFALSASNIEVVGYAAAVLTTVSFVPQVVKVFRERQAAGISAVMYALFTAGVALWLLYGLLIHSLPVTLANGVALGLAATVLTMKLRLG
jgi:MtN3 and saliva related transmembrane protein